MHNRGAPHGRRTGGLVLLSERHTVHASLVTWDAVPVHHHPVTHPFLFGTTPPYQMSSTARGNGLKAIGHGIRRRGRHGIGTAESARPCQQECNRDTHTGGDEGGDEFCEHHVQRRVGEGRRWHGWPSTRPHQWPKGRKRRLPMKSSERVSALRLFVEGRHPYILFGAVKKNDTTVTTTAETSNGGCEGSEGTENFASCGPRARCCEHGRR